MKMASWLSWNITPEWFLIRFTPQASCCPNRMWAILFSHPVGCACATGVKGVTWLLGSWWPQDFCWFYISWGQLSFHCYSWWHISPFTVTSSPHSTRWKGVYDHYWRNYYNYYIYTTICILYILHIYIYTITTVNYHNDYKLLYYTCLQGRPMLPSFLIKWNVVNYFTRYQTTFPQ